MPTRPGPNSPSGVRGMVLGLVRSLSVSVGRAVAGAVRCLTVAAVVILALTSALTGPAGAATDWLQYIASYEDLIRVFGANPAAGQQHYLQYGQAEGRSLDLFDEDQYLRNYPDLQAAFGTDGAAATVHYIQYGFFEGRTATPPSASRNILLLIADDLGVESTAFYPLRPGLQATVPPPPPMPNVARMASAGLIFTNAWANPLCAPTRAAIFTGRYGFRTGMGTNPNANGVPALASSEVILPEPFATRPDLNYLLGAIGKWHVSPGVTDPNTYGWPYYAGILPSRAGLELYNSWKKDVNGTVNRSRVYATTDQVEEAIGLIQTAERQGKRYFIQIAFNAPHNPYHVPPLDLHSYRLLPPYVPGAGSRPYFEAMVEALDTEIGRLLSQVSLSDTTVIFLGDNGTAGANLVPPYASARGKGALYEPGIRIPLVVAGAGVARPGRLVDGLVDTTDIFPTVLDLAGIAPPTGITIDGVSMLPYLQDNPGGRRRAWAFSESFTSATSSRRAIRNQTYKLITNGGRRELYNLPLDPMESTNLLARPLSTTERDNLDQLTNQLNALLASR